MSCYRERIQAYRFLRVALAASLPAVSILWPAKAIVQTGNTNVPHFLVDPFWPKPLPDKWLTGEVGGTCVDAKDHVFIANRLNLTTDEQQNSNPAPPVIEFDPEGNVANSWGDSKILPSNLHTCFVDVDGNIWIGGNHDGVVQKYSHDGKKLLLQIGQKGIFDTADGTMSGRALNSSQVSLNRPAGIAVDPGNGDIYISDGYGNRRIVVFDSKGKFVRQWGSQATEEQAQLGVGGVFLGTVHCVVLGNDSLVYACDRQGNRIQVFDKLGHFKRNIIVKPQTLAPNPNGSAWWLAFSPDKEQTFMFVADGASETVQIYDRASGLLLSQFGRPGHEAGAFTFLHTLAVDSRENIFTGEVLNGRRLQKFRKTND